MNRPNQTANKARTAIGMSVRRGALVGLRKAISLYTNTLIWLVQQALLPVLASHALDRSVIRFLDREQLRQFAHRCTRFIHTRVHAVRGAIALHAVDLDAVDAEILSRCHLEG